MKARTLGVLATLTLTTAASAQPTAFTYQGRLKNGSQLASGLHDFRFRLFDAATGGTQIGTTVCVDNTPITEGLFTSSVDFGQQFASPSPRFLEIEVRADTGLDCSNTGGFVLLAPRQALTAAPLATHAGTAFSLAAADGSPANAVIVDNSGNVGIGTGAPAVPLQIARDVDPVIVIQDTGPASTQAGYLGFWNSVSAETGWVGFGSPGSPHLSVVNARFGGHIALLPGSGGNVGIGTGAPAAKLDVRGDIRLGSSGQLRAAAGEENLRMLRGRIDGNGTVNSGSGFTCVRLNEGIYEITFNTAFVETPSVTATCVVPSLSAQRDANIFNVSTTSASIFIKFTGGSFTDSDFHFIVMGPR